MMRAAAGLLPLSMLLAAPAALACEDATTAELRLVIEEAEAAYIALDVEGVQDRLGALGALTPCLSEAIPRSDAARYHRIQGLGAFLGRDTEAAGRAFLAARSIEPDAPLPSSLVPAGHPVQVLYTERSLDTRTFGNLPEAAGSYLMLDGRRATRIPEDHPILFQRVEDTGTVAQTAYLWPGDPLPSFAVAPPAPIPVATEPEPVVEPVTEPAASPPPGRVPVLVVSGASAVATGAFLAMNRTRRTYYFSNDISAGELDAFQKKTNRTGAATLASATLAVAGGITLAVVW